jgi:transposase
MKSEKSAKIKERELIIKLSNEGKTCREIASILDISKSLVSFWVIRYKETGDLKDKPRSGQPTQLTKERLTSISEELKKRLQEQNGRAGISTKEVVKILEEETDKTYTPRHVQRLLHKMGFSLITPRVSHIKRNKEAQNKFREDFKKNFKRNMWVIRL